MVSNIVIIDSNFVLLPYQFKVDYLTEIRLLLQGELKFIIFQQVLNELEAKKRREVKSTKFGRLLNAGLSYLEKKKNNFNIKFSENIKQENETTDDFLLRRGCDLKNESRYVFLATNDSDLRRRARKLGLNTIFLRQKRYLSVERT